MRIGDVSDAGGQSYRPYDPFAQFAKDFSKFLSNPSQTNYNNVLQDLSRCLSAPHINDKIIAILENLKGDIDKFESNALAINYIDMELENPMLEPAQKAQLLEQKNQLVNANNESSLFMSQQANGLPSGNS